MAKKATFAALRAVFFRMKNLRTTLMKHPNPATLLLFLLLTHLLYGKTVLAGFATDFTGFAQRVDGAPFLDFLHCFGFPAMHQVMNFFLFGLYKTFGVNGLGWYVVYTSLHVGNAFLGFLLAKKIMAKAGVASLVPAFGAALLFLLSPYQAEAVVWKVSFGFLFCSLMMLGSLWQLAGWLENRRRKDLLWSHVFFVSGLFTFELAVALPLMALLVVAFWRASGPGHEPQNSWLPVFRQVTLPHGAIMAGWFLLNKTLLGGWVGHYGEGVHLRIAPASIGSNLLKYFSKYLLWWRDWPHVYKEKWMTFLEQPIVGWAAFSMTVLTIAVALFFYRKCPSRLRLTLFSGAFFITAVAPVSNLYVAWLLHGENDRYGYLASLFFFMGLMGLLMLFRQQIPYMLMALLFGLSLFLLQKMTLRWKHHAAVYNSLLQDFRWKKAKEVFVLAAPDNYEGIPMFRDFSGEELALKHALKYVAGKEPDAVFHEVAQYNLTAPTDGLEATTDPTGAIRLVFNQWGNWWWRNGNGTGDFETDRYRFRLIEKGGVVEMKTPAPNAVLIYATDGKWSVVGR
jgi:hypothetical protein